MVLQLHEYLMRCLSDIHTSPHQRKRPRIMVQVYLCVFTCAGMHTYPLLLCAYCMCGCIGLVSQLSSFAALVKRGATLMRRGTDSVSAAPDRVWGGSSLDETAPVRVVC